MSLCQHNYTLEERVSPDGKKEGRRFGVAAVRVLMNVAVPMTPGKQEIRLRWESTRLCAGLDRQLRYIRPEQVERTHSDIEKESR